VSGGRRPEAVRDWPGMRPLVERVRLNSVLVAVGASAAALGTAKTVAEAVTGTPFTVGDLAYYVGNVALVAYYGIAGCVLLLVAALMVDERISRADNRRSGAWEYVMLTTPILAGLAAAAYAVITFEWNPDAADSLGALISRLVGVGAVVGAVVAYRRPSES
jgi:hypothetical protein